MSRVCPECTGSNGEHQHGGKKDYYFSHIRYFKIGLANEQTLQKLLFFGVKMIDQGDQLLLAGIIHFIFFQVFLYFFSLFGIYFQ